MNVLTKILPVMLAVGILSAGPAAAEAPGEGLNFSHAGPESVTKGLAIPVGALEAGADEIMLAEGAERVESGNKLRTNEVKNFSHINVK